MMDRFSKGFLYALIPTGIVNLLQIPVLIIVAFAAFIAIHSIAFEYMFPEEQETEIVDYYGKREQIDTTLDVNFFPLILCRFIDCSILPGICGFFDLDIKTAFLIAPAVVPAPVSIPCLLLCNWLENKRDSIEKVAPRVCKIISIILLVSGIVAEGISLVIRPDPEVMLLLPASIILSIWAIYPISHKTKE